MTASKSRIKEFEALRGLSIVLLMILHSEILGFYVFGIHLGPSATYVASFLLGSFFFMGGFFYEKTLIKYTNRQFSHAWSKFLRIFPPYWFALFLFVFVMGFNLKRFDAQVYFFNVQFIFSPVYVKQLLTLWYISVMVAFYALYGVLILYARTNVWLLISSVAIFTVLYIFHLRTDYFDPRFFDYFFIFLLGVYFSRFKQFQENVYEIPLTYKIISAVLSVILFAIVQATGAEIIDLLYILAMDVFILAWVWMALDLFSGKLGDWRGWGFLSVASFMTYLYHRPIWHILALPFPDMPYKTNVVYNVLFGSVAALFVGYYFQRGYDRLLAALKLK